MAVVVEDIASVRLDDADRNTCPHEIGMRHRVPETGVAISHHWTPCKKGRRAVTLQRNGLEVILGRVRCDARLLGIRRTATELPRSCGQATASVVPVAHEKGGLKRRPDRAEFRIAARRWRTSIFASWPIGCCRHIVQQWLQV